MKFKQYLHGGIDEHMISCSKSNDIIDVVELVSAENATRKELRPTTITFKSSEDVSGEVDDILTFTSEGAEVDQLETNYEFALRYASVLSGMFADRAVATIKFYQDKVCFDVIVFDGNDKYLRDFSIYLTNFSRGMQMTVKMEPIHGLPYFRCGVPDTYVVTNMANHGEPMKIQIEEYRDSKLKRIRELGEDERGKFELITEP